MKNRLEAELISIAHRILKLKNKSEIIQLQQETLNLYQTLSVLRFVEENYGDPTVEIPSDIEEKLENPVVVAPEIALVNEQEIAAEPQAEIQETIVEEKAEVMESYEEYFEEKETIVEESTIISTELEETKEEEEEITEEPIAAEVEKTEEIIEETPATTEPVIKSEPIVEPLINIDDFQVKFEAFEAELSNAKPNKSKPMYEEISFANELFTDMQTNKPQHTEVKPTETIQEVKKSVSINDAVKKNFNIGLNDRIAFEFHLFGGQSEDFNRVISQLGTFDNFSEAKDFILNVVKPDYNNWISKDEYEARFLEIIENKFL